MLPNCVCQNVMESIKCCCATNITNPSRNPIENGVENRLIMNVPTISMPNWIVAVHIAAITNGSDAPLSSKLITTGNQIMTMTRKLHGKLSTYENHTKKARQGVTLLVHTTYTPSVIATIKNIVIINKVKLQDLETLPLGSGSHCRNNPLRNPLPDRSVVLSSSTVSIFSKSSSDDVNCEYRWRQSRFGL